MPTLALTDVDPAGNWTLRRSRTMLPMANR